ncbi:hypothetical protein KFL_002190430 [Klebsormidium nitens]|uniref:Uncharacterized protein n=1 Tax=Klebsormidium nitens TaxID=105231 RepID=A0A1Y1I557_KLENI|nr:hypothetical protein KFL_002190430 [Klebsormidium nitens]|eukprot:GAQ85092.1 hypothetical protein KFL_002190430 [Klebsormidium nitens]
MWDWFWKRRAATDEKNLLRRIADGKITKGPPRKRWGAPRYQEKTVTLPILGALPKRDLTDAEILMLGDIRRGAMDSDRATDENLAAFRALSRMDVDAGEIARTRPIITRRKYYSPGIPAADQGTYMSKVTYAADGILGRYWDSRNKVEYRRGRVIGDGPLFQNYLNDGFASYLRGSKKPLYVMVVTEGHIGCMLITAFASSVAVYLCIEAFNLAPADVYDVTSGIRDAFRSRRHSLYQMIMQVPVRESEYDQARLFMRASGGTVTESVVSAFPNGRIANEGTDARVQKDAFDLHCQTWIVLRRCPRLEAGHRARVGESLLVVVGRST